MSTRRSTHCLQLARLSEPYEHKFYRSYAALMSDGSIQFLCAFRDIVPETGKMADTGRADRNGDYSAFGWQRHYDLLTSSETRRFLSAIRRRGWR